MKTLRYSNWPNGGNNVAPPNRLPEGSVRRTVNLDATPAGTLELRPKFERVVPGENIRAVFALGRRIVIADGVALKLYDPDIDTTQELATISAAPIFGAALNGVLYLRSVADSLCFDGHVVRPWGLPIPRAEVSVEPGPLPAGIYKVAVTSTGPSGEESGAQVMTLTLPEGSAIRVSCDDPQARLYVSPLNTASLYYQGEVLGRLRVAAISDDAERLATAGLQAFPVVDGMVAYGAMLVGWAGGLLVHTQPMMPHLTRPLSDFIQYPAPVRLVAPTQGGLYVATENETYFVTGLGSPSVQQRVVLALGATSGTFAALPDGSVTWFCPRGQVIAGADGIPRLLNENRYAPLAASSGAAGVIEHEGSRLAVTTLRGAGRENNLQAADFWEVEMY